MSSLQTLVSSPFCLAYSSWVPITPATFDETQGGRPPRWPTARARAERGEAPLAD